MPPYSHLEHVTMAIDFDALPPDLAELAAARFSGAKKRADFAERSQSLRETLRLPPRESTDGMNKLERRFSEHLTRMQSAGKIRAWWREPVKLRLAGKTFYTPDFMVLPRTHIGIQTFVECKGFMRDDAAVKLKVAAATYPCYSWILVRAAKGHTWNAVEVDGRGIGTTPLQLEWL